MLKGGKWIENVSERGERREMQKERGREKERKNRDGEGKKVKTGCIAVYSAVS